MMITSKTELGLRWLIAFTPGSRVDSSLPSGVRRLQKYCFAELHSSSRGEPQVGLDGCLT